MSEDLKGAAAVAPPPVPPPLHPLVIAERARVRKIVTECVGRMHANIKNGTQMADRAARALEKEILAAIDPPETTPKAKAQA
jgi:hypothetical protein